MNCEHEYCTITNLYGNFVTKYSRFRIKKIRSIQRCKHCGKIKKPTELDDKCDVINFNLRSIKGGRTFKTNNEFKW